MKIEVKRKDSVSSILLFIFNVFLVERGINAIPLKKIFRLLEPFKKNESAIRMGLSREVHNGLLVNQRKNNEVYYCLTEEAIVGFRYWMKVMDFTQDKALLQSKKWNGNWSILLIIGELVDPEGINISSGNFPEKLTDLKILPEKNTANNKVTQTQHQSILEAIAELGFANVNKSLWISPYNFDERLSHLIHELNLESKIYLFTSQLALTNHESAMTLAEACDLVSKIWPIENLMKRYQDFLTSLGSDLKELNSGPCRDGRGLPFLYRAGLVFFEIAQDDPHLPLELLPPDWPGIEAVTAFNRLREDLLPEANQFIDRVLNENLGP